MLSRLREKAPGPFRLSIISRYLAQNFLKTWALALFGFLVLYTAIDFLEKIGDFMGKGVGLKTIALFFVAQLPKVVVLMVPVATLVGVLITLAVLARASEIVAFKAGGVSLLRLSAPIVGSSLMICALVFILSDLVAPRATAVANSIWQGLVKERLSSSTAVQDVWLKDVRLIQHFKSYDEADGQVLGVTLIFTDDEMYLARRIEAAGGRFVDGQLRLDEAEEKVYERPENALEEAALLEAGPDFPAQIRPGRAEVDDPASPKLGPDAYKAPRPGRSFKLNRHKVLVLDDWPAPPPGFGRADQNSDELSTAQLWRSIDRLRAEGFNPVKQRVDLQFKFSFALLSFIMVAVGLPIGFWKEKGGSVALGLAVGLALSFLYLIVMELARSLGYAGFLPPLAAAWLPNLLFLLLGAYLFSYVRQ